MITYTKKPSWFYKPIHIENLEAIQQELLTVLYKKIPNFEDEPPVPLTEKYQQKVSSFHYTSREEIEPYAPLYTEFIRSLGLLDKWFASPIVTAYYQFKFPIHIDNADWFTNCYGLNIPIINCEDTYTVWYDADIEYNKPFQSKSDTDIKSVTRLIKPNTPYTEIARWHMKDPAWINVSIPHAPVTYNKKPRAAISARFIPEIHDLMYNP